MNEEKLDRRAHWIQIIVTGIVIATGWCVKLEMSNSNVVAKIHAMEENSTHYRDQRKQQDIDNEHRFTALEKDVEWLKSGGRTPNANHAER